MTPGRELDAAVVHDQDSTIEAEILNLGESPVK